MLLTEETLKDAIPNIKKMSCLELFGGDTTSFTGMLVGLTKDITIWEKDISLVQQAAAKSIPIHHVDSLREIKKKPWKQFDVVSADIFILCCSRVEHDGLFPHIYQWLKPHGYFITNLFLDVDLYMSDKDESVKKTVLKARKKFYGTERPTVEQMLERLRPDKLGDKRGFSVVSETVLKRTSAVSLLIQELRAKQTRKRRVFRSTGKN